MDMSHFQLAFGLSLAYIGHVFTRQTENWTEIMSGCALVAMGIFSVISALIDLEIIF